MKFSHMKFYAAPAAMVCACAIFAAPVAASPTAVAPAPYYAAANDLGFSRVALKPIDLLALRRMDTRTGAPRVMCDPTQPQKICDVRKAAAQRAWEVMTEENAAAENAAEKTPAPQDDIPLSLLIPAGFVIPVRAIACDPALSTEECAKLDRRAPSNPSGPLPPNAQPPAVPTPPPPVTLPESKTPPTAVDPVPVTPPSVIPPPKTGDDDLVKKPPKTNSQMPVIKPKAAPPVNPQP